MKEQNLEKLLSDLSREYREFGGPGVVVNDGVVDIAEPLATWRRARARRRMFALSGILAAAAALGGVWVWVNVKQGDGKLSPTATMDPKSAEMIESSRPK